MSDGLFFSRLKYFVDGIEVVVTLKSIKSFIRYARDTNDLYQQKIA